jgi:hypothetical protein
MDQLMQMMASRFLLRGTMRFTTKMSGQRTGTLLPATAARRIDFDFGLPRKNARGVIETISQARAIS